MTTRSATLAFLTVLVSGAACSGPAASPPAVRRGVGEPHLTVRAAAETTAGAGTARVRFAVRAERPATAGPDPVPAGHISGEGSFDFAAGRGWFTMTVPSFADNELGAVEAMSDQGVLYLRLPPGPPHGLTPGWVKLRPGALASVLALDPLALAQAHATDPSQALRLLTGATTGTSFLGPSRAWGEELAHYRVAVEVAAPPPPGAGAPRRDGPAPAPPGGRLVVETALDRRGRVRRLAYSLPAPASVATPPAVPGAGVVLELFDFGTPVAGSPPSPDEVVDPLVREDAATPAPTGDGGRRRGRRRPRRSAVAGVPPPRGAALRPARVPRGRTSPGG